MDFITYDEGDYIEQDFWVQRRKLTIVKPGGIKMKEIHISKEALKLVGASRKGKKTAIENTVRFTKNSKISTDGVILAISKREDYEPWNKTVRFENRKTKCGCFNEIIYEGKEVMESRHVAGSARFVDEAFPNIRSFPLPKSGATHKISFDAKKLYQLADILSSNTTDKKEKHMVTLEFDYSCSAIVVAHVNDETISGLISPYKNRDMIAEPLRLYKGTRGGE